MSSGFPQGPEEKQQHGGAQYLTPGLKYRRLRVTDQREVCYYCTDSKLTEVVSPTY